MTLAYEAVNENPRVFVAFGKTPDKALKAMTNIVKENSIRWWSASHVGYIEDEKTFYINIYV